MIETSDNGRQPIVQHWLNEIEACKKREKSYRDEGKRILELYEGEKNSPFNILYSNTETMGPALYSAVPRPVVQRRFKDEDVLGKAASTAGQRMLSFLLDTNMDGYETFDEGMGAAVLDSLLPGRGVTTVKYDADIGELPGETPTEYKASELVCLDSRHWNRVYFGYAKKWSKVPWIAYEENIDKEEAIRLFGEEVTGKITFTDNEEKGEDKTTEDQNKGERKTACIYQIWDKDGGKKVRYISAQYKDGYLKEEDDPLGLTGFFNCPKPLQFLKKSANLTPTALYKLYEEQAKELNELSRRIIKIAQAIKARGIYDGALGEDLGRLVEEATDNQLIPAEVGSALSTEKGMDKAIWYLPIEALVAVLQQLLLAREQCKQTIYEITGIADIMRGQTNASETLGAQEIKEGWGKLRLKRLQKEVQRYARDLLRMMLEIAATKFSEETWAKMTGLPFVTTERRMQLDMIAQQAQMSGQQLDPQTQALLQAPVWGQVIELLRDDMQRAFRIDIETNSTVEAEATEDQKMIADVMNALSQLLNGMGPLVLQGVLPFEAAQQMMLAIVRRFRFGPEIEDQIKAMKPPAPPDQAEQQQKQQENQLKLQEMQMKLQGEQAKQEGEKQKQAVEMEKAQLQAQLDREMMLLEAELKREEHRMKMEEMKSKHECSMQAGVMKMAEMKERAKQPKARPN
jgi:hypothetical protein